MIGRMLFAIISGQMLGSVVSGFANDAFGWHSSLVIGAGVGAVAAASPGSRCRPARAGGDRDSGSFAGALRPRLRQPEGALAVSAACRRGHVLLRPLPVHGRAAAGTTERRPAARSPADHRPGPRRLRHRRPALRGQRARRAAPLGVRRMCLIGSAFGRGLLRGARRLADVVARGARDVRRRRQLLHAAQLDADRGDRARALGARLGGGPLRLRLLHRPGLGPLAFGALLHGLGARPALFAVAAVIVVLGRVVVAPGDRPPRRA